MILLVVSLVGMGLFGLRGSTADHALSKPRGSPLAQSIWGWTVNIKVNDDPGTAEQGLSAIAVDSSGNAYAVWQDLRNDPDGGCDIFGITSCFSDIYFSYRPAGGSWGTNVKVNDDLGTATQWVPSIAVDSSGNAYAVWQDYRNDPDGACDISDINSCLSDIYFSYRPAGGSWGTNIRVNDDLGTAEKGKPAIAVDSSGNAYAVWHDSRNGDYDIYFSYRPAGGGWGTNVRVNDDPAAAYQHAPAIAMDSSGHAYAVWRDKRNGDWDIYFSYRPAGGSWGANAKVNDDPGMESQGHPAIAVVPSGHAYAVWRDKRNGDWDTYFSYRPAGGSWGANVKVNDDPGMESQWHPAIAVVSSGNAYAVWKDYRNGDYDIYFSYRPAGGSWGPNVRVNDDPGTASQLNPAIAVDGSGNAYAVWEDRRNGDADIYFSYGLWWEPTSFVYLPIIMKNY